MPTVLSARETSPDVIAGLDPAIQGNSVALDARVKPGHDREETAVGNKAVPQGGAIAFAAKLKGARDALS